MNVNSVWVFLSFLSFLSSHSFPPCLCTWVYFLFCWGAGSAVSHPCSLSVPSSLAYSFSMFPKFMWPHCSWRSKATYLRHHPLWSRHHPLWSRGSNGGDRNYISIFFFFFLKEKQWWYLIVDFVTITLIIMNTVFLLLFCVVVIIIITIIIIVAHTTVIPVWCVSPIFRYSSRRHEVRRERWHLVLVLVLVLEGAAHLLDFGVVQPTHLVGVHLP